MDYIRSNANLTRVPSRSRELRGYQSIVASATVAIVVSVAPSLMAAPGSWQGNLSAQRGPTNVLTLPLVVEKRELVSVSVTGQIKLGEAPLSGPEGTGYYGYDPETQPPYGYSHGIVILQVNSNRFPIEGGTRQFESPHNGPISIYVNDNNTEANQGQFAVTVTIQRAIPGDWDEDGVEDSLEDELLDLYAPTLRFDTDETMWPVDVYWYLRNVDLLVDGDESSTKILNRKQTPYYPEWFLQQMKSGQSTNYLDVSDLVLTYCNIRNSHRDGEIGLSVAPNTGVYGHVVPTTGAIVVQYWLFYGYNETGIVGDIADHEGDWELVELFLDPINPTNVSSMKKVLWHGHGLDFTAKWEGGSWWVNEEASLNGPLPVMPPLDGHISVFVEANTHGSWPTYVDYGAVGKNRGNGEIRLPTNVINVGEVFRPRLGTELVTQFNGRWGAFKCCGSEVSCPPGPVLHASQWVNPTPTSTEAQYVGTWSAGASINNSRGRISWPWQTLADAVAATPSGSEVIVFPGSYPGATNVDKPIQLCAPHGAATIGGFRLESGKVIVQGSGNIHFH